MKLILLSIACLIAAALVPMASRQSPQAATIMNLQGQGLGGFTQKTITGPAVAARAITLRAKNKGVDRAMGDLERKGLRPAFYQGISILEVRNAATSRHRTNRFLKASFQSETFSDDGYEMTFFSYDDGNPNTWEGVIYEHDPDGHEYEYTASIDISGQQENWNRIEETYYPWDGSEPVSSNDPAYYNGRYYPNDPMTRRTAKIDSTNGGSAYLVKTSFTATPQWCCRPPGGYPIPPHWRDRSQRWLRCAAGGCTASAIGCIASGPGWAACFGWWCGGAGAGCIILTW